MKFDYAIASEKGPRPQNEDAVRVWEMDGGKLAVAVADGLGGHAGGRKAADLAIEMFGAAVTRTTTLSDLGHIGQEIHEAIKKQQQTDFVDSGMATTLSAAIIEGNEINVCHCGDTRVFLQRGEGIKRLTQDHTEANRLYSAGKISKREYLHYPRKHVLESALGIQKRPTIDTVQHRIEAGDRIFFTSDGVHGKVLTRELKSLSDSCADAKCIVERVVQEVISRSPDDNFSIVAVIIT